MNQKWIALLLALILALSVCGCAADKPQTETAETTASVETQTAAGQSTVTDEELTQTAQWLMEQIPQPTYGSVGGEWAVFGLARSGVAVPKEYFEVYGENVAAYTAEHGGVLHAKKYTEYSRVILAWTALGKDATDVGGFNLLVPLADFDQTVFQGINGPIFALLALDSGAYDIPENTAGTTQATRDGYVDYILNAELPGGGWSFAGGDAETDITAMALQALAKYRDRQDVADAVERGLTVLSQQQEENGGFVARPQLLKVPKLGKKAYEQCAGFLRISGGKNPLDATAVHPESYPIAEGLLTLCGCTLADIGTEKLRELPTMAEKTGYKVLAQQLSAGEPTVRDIIAELQKPGRDPRESLPPTVLRSDVLEMKDLKPEMELTGTVRNVVDFGAFVDIGVHEDGLVHISQIGEKYVKHPSEVLKVGDIVRVKVLEVDQKRGRISLTMRGVKQPAQL